MSLAEMTPPENRLDVRIPGAQNAELFEFCDDLFGGWSSPQNDADTNLLFFGTLMFLTLTGLPWYAVKVGFTQADWLLFAFFTVMTGLSITVGYHRLFAHRSFEASPLIRVLAIFFGAAAFEQSTLMWASQHRDHHRRVAWKKFCADSCE